MQSANHRHLLAIATLCLASATMAAAEDKSTYGKVDTFEPGKKYSCLPTSDHKAWDCAQIGKASDHPPVAAPAPALAPVAPQTAPPVDASAASTPVPASSAPVASPTRSGELPSYLSAAAGTGGAAPRQPAAPPPIPAPKVPTSTVPPPAPAPAQQPVAAAPVREPLPTAEPTAAPKPVAATPAAPPAPKPEPLREPAKVESPSPAPVAAQAPPRRDAAARGSDAFFGLGADQYVIELAHGASEAEIDAANAQAARGNVYKLHLRQNGAEIWLLVCGSYDDVSAARAARAEIAAAGAVTPGWPRRVGPLQAEMRRAGN